MSTSHSQAGVASSPAVRRQGEARAAVDIRRSVSAWEPASAGRTSLLDVVKGPRGQRDSVGSMRSGDGAWLNFRSPDVASGWAVASRATIMTSLATVLCVGAGLYALRASMRPSAQSARAADAMAHGQPAASRESGPAESRDSARSLNDMQARISGSETDQAKSFEVISHDSRTPLSRSKIASDFVDDSDISRIVSSSTEEMEAMSMSLQSFSRAQHMTADAAEVDLVAMVRDLSASSPGETHSEAPPVALARTYREPSSSASTPSVENASQYGERARVTISGQDSRWRIEIADDGDESGSSTSAVQIGYRVASSAADASISVSADKIGWPGSYSTYGVSMSIGVAGARRAVEPSRADAVRAANAAQKPLWTPRGLWDAIAGP
ncbi:hypothetical protein OY671_007860, partial [Metschnikowia pulcherrima]